MLLLVRKYAHIYVGIYPSGIQALRIVAEIYPASLPVTHLTSTTYNFFLANFRLHNYFRPLWNGHAKNFLTTFFSANFF